VKPLETLAKRVIDAAAKDKNTTSIVLNCCMSIQNGKPRMIFHSSSKSSVVSGDCHFLVRNPVSRLGKDKEESQDDAPGTVPLCMRRARWLNNNDLLRSPLLCFQAIPPTLLCPQFSQFVIDLDSCTPSTLDGEQFHQLRHIMADL